MYNSDMIATALINHVQREQEGYKSEKNYMHIQGYDFSYGNAYQ